MYYWDLSEYRSLQQAEESDTYSGQALVIWSDSYVTGKVCEKLKASYKNYLLACLAGFVVTYAIGIVYKFIILNFYAHTPATLGVIFLSCFPLDMPGDFVLCLLAAGVGLRMRKSGFYLS